jgi:FtsZ-interacting cell division protein ZipA
MRIDQIYFSFDVPLIPIELNPFIKMLEVGQLLAKELEGRLLDDNGQALSILLTQNIENQLEPIYQLMKERQIEPGSATALRLFN